MTMRSLLRSSLPGLPATALLGLLLMAGGCNDTLDDPVVSDNLVSVAAIAPTTACVDVDGELQENALGGFDTVYREVQQAFTFQSRLRNEGDSVWNDVILSAYDISYTMTDGGSVPPPATGRSISPVTIPAGGVGRTTITTVPVAHIGPGLEFSTPQRIGQVQMVFHGQDMAGNPVTVNGSAPLGTFTICGTE